MVERMKIEVGIKEHCGIDWVAHNVVVVDYFKQSIPVAARLE